jgi:hypothetical protein
MQDMFRPAQFGSKDTVTEAEMDFCPTKVEQAVITLPNAAGLHAN